jgi:rhodanese-related sulfurtransferase
MIDQLSPAELAAWRDDPGREDPLIVDVREAWEVAICRLEPSHHVPLAKLPAVLHTLPRERELVLVCHHGVRSMHAGMWLRSQGFERLHNLHGGIAAWADTVEPGMPRY